MANSVKLTTETYWSRKSKLDPTEHQQFLFLKEFSGNFKWMEITETYFDDKTGNVKSVSSQKNWHIKKLVISKCKNTKRKKVPIGLFFSFSFSHQM